MDATNWQRPVDADGKLDLRLEDRWTVKKGPPPAGIVKSLPCGACGEIAMLTEKHGLQVTTVHELGALESRNGIAWTVPEDKRKGRWVMAWERNFASHALYVPGLIAAPTDRPAHCSADTMVWSPDFVVAPEPVWMDAPEPGKQWERDVLVYRPIHDGDGILRYRMPNGASLFLHSANGATDFVGYYYPAHNGKAAAIRCDDMRYRNPLNGKCSTRYSPGDEIVRPTHVCFKKGGE